MSAMIISIVNFGIGGSAFWRAVFVASLAVIAFALVRYWQNLSHHLPRTRYLLVALRAASLLLLACALAGVYIEYEAVMQPRVLVYGTSSQAFAKVDERESAVDEAAGRVLDALRLKNFTGVLNQTEESESATTQPAPFLAGVVVTDGAMRAADARLWIERASAATGGAPLFVVTDLQAAAGPGVALDSITVMSRPVRGVPLTVRCLVHARGMSGRASLVTISDDAQVRSSAEARWASDDERQVLTLEVVPKSAGWINYVAKVEAAGMEDAATLSRRLTLYAEERRQRVLFFEGEPTWEAKFIRRALEEAELFEVDYFAQVSRAAVVGVKEQAAENNQEQTGNANQAQSSGKAQDAGSGPDAKLRAALSSAARLNTYDCIIIGATPDALLSGAEAARLRDWVERRGGGLVVLGGNGFAGSVAAPNAKLYALLPALVDPSSFRSDAQAQSRNAPVEAESLRGGVPLTPTQFGASGPLRGFLSASEGAQQKNSVLTGQGLRLGALRAGASVLAVSGQAGEDGTGEAGAPLLAARRYGTGRTIIFAPADSWRIRTGASGEQAEKGGPFASLWQGIALWATATARPPVEIVLSDESPAAGTFVTAELRVRDEIYAPLKIEKLSARLQSLAEDSNQSASVDDTSQEIIFAPDKSDASIWRARFAPDTPARFSLNMEYTANGKSGAAQKYFAVVAQTPTARGASRDTLQRLARATGGELFSASALDLMTEKLSALPQSRERVRRTWELRDWWPLAFIIPLLLSTEWLLARMKKQG